MLLIGNCGVNIRLAVNSKLVTKLVTKQGRKLRSFRYYVMRWDSRGFCKNCKDLKVLHTPPLAASKSYPDFTTGLHGVENENVDGVRLVEILENLNKKRQYKKAIEVFREFHCRKPDWLHQWPAQKIAAVILHAYRKTGLFNCLYSLHDELVKAGFRHGEGIYVTLIKSSLQEDNWERALKYLEELKNIGLRNVRIYPHVIKNLISNNHFEKAMDLFKEMQNFELSQKTKKPLQDQTLLVEIIYGYSKHVLHEQSNKADVKMKESSELVYNMLDYLSDRCFVLSTALSDVIVSKLNQFNADFSIEPFERQRMMSRSNLNDETLSDKDIEIFINHISMTIKDEMGKSEIEDVHKFIAVHGPFCNVIDGSNVLLSKGPGFQSIQTKFKPTNLLHLLKYCKNILDSGKSAIVMSSAIESRSMFSESKLYATLREKYEMEVLIVSHIPDDVALLLTCLFSCLHSSKHNSDVKLITNDYLRDHISALGHHRWKFLNWIHSRHWRYSWDWNNKITLHNNKPLLQKQSRWILPLDDGRNLLIMKKGL